MTTTPTPTPDTNEDTLYQEATKPTSKPTSRPCKEDSCLRGLEFNEDTLYQEATERMNDLFSDWHPISRYRRLEIEEAAGLISDLMENRASPEYVSGAMEMLKRMLYAPRKLFNTSSKTPKTSQLLNSLLKADYRRAATTIVRNKILGDNIK